MTAEDIRISNERALTTTIDIIVTREANLEMAERHFPGSDMAKLAKAQLEAAHRDYADMQERVARVRSLIEGL